MSSLSSARVPWRTWVAAAVAAVALTGCADARASRDVGALPAECGLRPVDPNARAADVPEAFLPPHSQLVEVHRPRIGGLSAIVNLARPVEETFELYKDASARAGFEVSSVDFEGFEGEIWLRSRKELGSVVVRGSSCPDASGVIISIVSKKDLEG